VKAENKAVSCLRKITVEIPERFEIFTGCPSLTSSITEVQFTELGAAKFSIDDLFSYCKHVRKCTIAYLDSITDGKLKEIPDRGGVDNYDPIREEFVKLILMQNFVLDKLRTIAQIIAGDAD
jgi:hypothetical protein